MGTLTGITSDNIVFCSSIVTVVLRGCNLCPTAGFRAQRKHSGLDGKRKRQMRAKAGKPDNLA